jgi:periplasmic divalent cation tolerance protein
MGLIAVLTTIDSEDGAKQIATALVDRKLAACVQISRIESYYSWEGKTRNDAEFRLVIKTKVDRYADVEAAILELHSYDLAAIYSVDLAQVHAPYAEWVVENSSGS